MVISRETQRGIFRFLISARRKVACKRLVISINFKASLLLFFSSRRRHTIYWLDWSSDVCSSDLPFRDLSDMPLAMTAHVAYAALDAARPATLSATLIETAIRGRIGFDGALISDDLGMHALDGRSEERRVGKECRSRWSPYH